MKLAIVGTRQLTSYQRFRGRLRYHYPDFSEVTEIVSGGAKGTDSLAERLAEDLNIPTKIFLPEYTKYSRNAPLMRNTQIVEYADKVIAFVDNSSRGTHDTIRKASKLNKLHSIIYLDDEHEVLESWFHEGLCEKGFETRYEEFRKRGDNDIPAPRPNYRILIETKVPNNPIEGGYFHYYKDAWNIKTLLEQTVASETVVKIEELPEKEYEFKENIR